MERKSSQNALHAALEESRLSLIPVSTVVAVKLVLKKSLS